MQTLKNLLFLATSVFACGGVFRVLPVLLVPVCWSHAAPDTPVPPRVDFVEPEARQPWDTDAATIWYDDFDRDRAYHEPATGSEDCRFSLTTALGGVGTGGRSMECHYAQGHRGRGGRKLLFGDAPFGKPVREGEHFDEIHWRYYLKYPRDWQGGGEAKQSRATIFTSPSWTQASILHVWTSGDPLTLDPVRGVADGTVVTTRYNDFANFKWLGNAPKGRFPLHANDESGRWVCVEVRWKLNTPGAKDGVAQLWIDGELDSERVGMDFRGSYGAHGINAVFLESYWNDGSPADQYRWLDEFVVSTGPIGPVTVPVSPVVHVRLEDASAGWQVEVVDSRRGEVAWRSGGFHEGDRVRIGPLAGGGAFRFRVRQRIGGSVSDWSPLHWPVVTGER